MAAAVSLLVLHGSRRQQARSAPTVSTALALRPPLLSNAASFFSAALVQSNILLPSLLTNAQTFYAPAVGTVPHIDPPLIVNSQSFFGPQINRKLTAALVSNGQSFPSASIITGNSLGLQLFTNAQSFFGPSLRQSATVPLLSDPDQFFAATILTSGALNPPLLSNTQSFFRPQLNRTIRPSLVTNPQSFFGPSLTSGATPGTILSAPTVTLTSVAGDPPEANIVMGSDIYAGYYLRIQRSTDGTKNVSDGTYANATLNIAHSVTPSEIAALAITNADLAPDGYYDPTGTWHQQYRWEREDGALSGWSAGITGTVTVSVAALSTTTGNDKSNKVDVSGLTFTGNSNVSTLCGSRATVAAVNTKFHFEVTVNAFNATGRIYLGVTDATQPMGPSTGLAVPGASGAPGCSYRGDVAGSGTLWRNGSSTGAAEGATQVGDVLVCEVDRSANTVKFFRRRSGVNTQVGSTITLTSGIPAQWYAYVGTYRSGDSGTVNFGASAFAMTPSTGYGYYG